jgi:hypothetical protein
MEMAYAYRNFVVNENAYDISVGKPEGNIRHENVSADEW